MAVSAARTTRPTPMTGPSDEEARWYEDWSAQYHQQNTLERLAAELAEMPISPPSTNGNTPAAEDRPAPINVPLDWEAEFQHDYSAVSWLPGKVCERGQQVAFVGDGKVGKSLFWFEWCWRAGNAEEFLFPVDCPPLTVVYCDRENSRRDLVMRAQAIGATAGSLVNLVYYSFPQVPNLDVNGNEVLQFAERATADVVILDTISRFVGGKENDSDTWLNLYRSVHAKLKAANRTGIRLDHPGKDVDKGARGSSAKNQDVDVVWEMTSRGEKERGDQVITDMRLTRTHSRTGLGPSVIDIVRRGTKDPDSGLWLPGSTSHDLAGRPHPAAPVEPRIQAAVDALDLAGVDPRVGRDRLRNEAANLGLNLRLGTGDWAKVVKARKDAEIARQQSPPIGGVSYHQDSL